MRYQHVHRFRDEFHWKCELQKGGTVQSPEVRTNLTGPFFFTQQPVSLPRIVGVLDPYEKTALSLRWYGQVFQILLAPIVEWVKFFS